MLVNGTQFKSLQFWLDGGALVPVELKAWTSGKSVLKGIYVFNFPDVYELLLKKKKKRERMLNSGKSYSNKLMFFLIW